MDPTTAAAGFAQNWPIAGAMLLITVILLKFFGDQSKAEREASASQVAAMNASFIELSSAITGLKDGIVDSMTHNSEIIGENTATQNQTHAVLREVQTAISLCTGGDRRHGEECNFNV